MPKGSIIVANAWAINRDTDLYGPDAHVFNPNRFLDPASNTLLPPLSDTKKEGHATFGFGRRICPGRHVANDVLMINATLILWAMELHGPCADDGNEVLPEVEGSVLDGVVA